MWKSANSLQYGWRRECLRFIRYIHDLQKPTFYHREFRKHFNEYCDASGLHYLSLSKLKRVCCEEGWIATQPGRVIVRPLFFCDVCGVYCIDSISYQSHIDGKKHAKAVRWQPPQQQIHPQLQRQHQQTPRTTVATLKALTAPTPFGIQFRRGQHDDESVILLEPGKSLTLKVHVVNISSQPQHFVRYATSDAPMFTVVGPAGNFDVPPQGEFPIEVTIQYDGVGKYTCPLMCVFSCSQKHFVVSHYIEVKITDELEDLLVDPSMIGRVPRPRVPTTYAQSYYDGKRPPACVSIAADFFFWEI
jgi:hypothetical protein